MRQRDRVAGRRLATAPLLAAVLPLLAAVAAAAHGTRAEVTIQQTGDRDLLVQLRWAEDGHAIVEPAQVDVSATNSATGQTVGPLTASARAEPGDDAVTLPVGDGRWVVDAKATGPAAGQGTRTIDVPLPPGAASVPGAAATESDRRPLLFGLLAGGVTLLAGIAVVTRLNRRALVRLAARSRGRRRTTPARGGRSAPARSRRGARAGAGARPKRRRG